MREAIREAANQLPSNKAGILLVGGPFWNAEQLNCVAADAHRLWDERRTQHPMITAVMIVSTTAEMRPRAGQETAPFDWSNFEFLTAMHGRWIANPRYSGHLRLEFAEGLVGPFDISFRPGS